MSVPENKEHKAEPHPEAHKSRAAKAPTVPEECAALQLRLEAAIEARDGDALKACWEEMDRLYKEHAGSSKAEDHDHVAALSRTFHRLVSRA